MDKLKADAGGGMSTDGVMAAVPPPDPLARAVAERDAANAYVKELERQVRHWQQKAAAGVAPTRGLGRADAEWWLEHRPQIIDALAARGLQIVSDANRVWLAPLPAGVKTPLEGRDG